MSGQSESAPMIPHYAPAPRLNSRSLPVRIADILRSLLSTNRGRVILLAYLTFAFVVLKYNPLGDNARDPYADERYATYATPFCGPSGICGEKADEPSPRTKYSARSAEQMELWTKAVEDESQRAITYNLHLEALRAGGGAFRPLILLGDSITESYLGSSYGQPQDRFADVPSVLKTEYTNFEPLVLGISGDQTQHLLWRLMNGGILPEYASDPNAVFVVLIGTNNIGGGEEPGEVNQALRTIAQYLLEEVKGRIIFVELLTRGDVFRTKDICPPRCDENGKPLSSFMPSINEVNTAMRENMSRLTRKYRGRISTVNCNGVFAPDEAAVQRGEEVNTALMPDSLHPNADGHHLLAQCVLKCIDKEDGICAPVVAQ